MEKEKILEFDELFSHSTRKKDAIQEDMPIEAKEFLKQVGNSSVIHYVQEVNKILTATDKERDNGWKETIITSVLVLIAGLIVSFFSGAHLSAAVAMLVFWLFLFAKKVYGEQREVYLRTNIGYLKKPLSLTESKLFYLTIVREKIKNLDSDLKNKVLKAATENFGFKAFDINYDYTTLPVFLDSKFKEVDLFIEGEISKNNHGLTKEELEIIKTSKK